MRNPHNLKECDRCKLIFTFLSELNRLQTTRQISIKTEMSWKTTKDHLLNLFNKGMISRKKLKNRTYWKANK